MRATFIKAVEERNLRDVRIKLSKEMEFDPRGETFQEMLRYAEEKLDNLYEEHDSKGFREDSTTWTEDYLSDVKQDLSFNFSKERLDHYYKVAKFVLKEKAEKLDQEELDQARSREQNNDTETYTIGRKTIYGGVTLGGAVVTAASFFVEKAALRIALSSLGVAGLVIGGALLLRELNKK